MLRFNDSRIFFKELYPLKIILLVLTPELLGIIIDYDLFDSRYIIIDLIWLLMFTIPYYFFQKIIIYKVGAIVYFFVGIIEISHWIILKGPITLTSLMVLANTNYNEAIEFMDLKASFWLLILIPYSVLFIVTIKNPPSINHSKQKLYIIVLLVLVSIIFISENAINGRFIRKGVPQIVKVTSSFFEKMALYKEAMQEKKPKKVKVSSNLKSKQQTFVLIIGESCSRRHMSIYGSKRITTPKLDKRNDLIKYTNVVSPYSSTLNAVLTIFSDADLENRIEFDKSTDLIDIFHSAGYKTYWLSNQSPIGVWDNLITVLAKKSDYTKFVNISSNSSFEATKNSSYDEKLFKPLNNVLKENVDKKFIVLQLMGSHSSYSKRYPSEYNIFKGDGTVSETIAEYDNSILYNDFIVDSLFNIINQNVTQKNNFITSAIYISDHGENVYDEFDRVGHDYANDMPKVNVEIPFLVWLSPTYLSTYKSNSEIVKANCNLPFVTDDLFHAIMDLNGINCTYFREEKSVFNTKFNSSRKRILEDLRDYDEK